MSCIKAFFKVLNEIHFILIFLTAGNLQSWHLGSLESTLTMPVGTIKQNATGCERDPEVVTGCA